MKLKILYHSGAGSTQTIAEVYHELLNCSSCSIESVSLNYDYSSLEDIDILVFGFPTYHCAPSTTALDFIDKMPAFVQPVRLFVFTTYALYPGNALRKFIGKAARKNLVLCGHAAYRSPASDGSLLLPHMNFMFNYGKTVPKLVQRDVSKIRSILRGQTAIKVRKPGVRLYTILNFPNSFIAKRFKMTFTILMDRCIQCGRCQRNCLRGCWEDTEGGPVVNYANCESCWLSSNHRQRVP
ncbi:MAG: hypothetical protein PQJ50_05220 [Spirochaetales bacterium]|nr:hypothetical protein [Spirochaetales bacterium]